jgi:integrase
MAWSTIVRRRTSWNPLHSWIAPAGAGRRRPCPGTTAADRLVTKGSAIHRARRRSRRSLPSCAPLVMTPTGVRLRGLIVVLWRAGLRISEALALAESDLDRVRGAIQVRHGKGGRRREVGMDRWASQAYAEFRVMPSRRFGEAILPDVRKHRAGRSLGIIPVVPEYRRCAEPAGSAGRPRTDRNAHARRPYPEEALTDARPGQHGVWRRRTVGPHPVPGPGAPEQSRSQSRRRIMPSIPSPRPPEYSNSSIDSCISRNSA